MPVGQTTRLNKDSYAKQPNVWGVGGGVPAAEGVGGVESEYVPGEDRSIDLAAANVKWNTVPALARLGMTLLMYQHYIGTYNYIPT